MGFNFCEEEITEMYRMYQETWDAIQEQTKNIAEALAEHAKKMKYEPVINLAIESINYYNNDLKAVEKKALSDWQEGELSFTAIMRKMSAGEEAEARSRRLEGEIESQIDSWGSLDSSQFSSIPKANWNGDAQDFQMIKQTIDNFVSTLENTLGQMASRVGNKKDENEIYISIEPVILQSIKIVIDGFRDGISGSFSELAEAFNLRQQEVRNLGNATAQNVSAKSQSMVSDGVSALKAKVKTILE